MTDAQQREAARQFFYRWNGKGREDEDARSYWIEILTNILGVDRVTERVDFEKKVTAIEVCFVSTNSICQGSQVPILWNVLLKDFHVHINFAYQTFRWNSESTDQAAVHCVIVSFAIFNRKEKTLFPMGSSKKVVSNISPYLTEGSDTFVVAAKEALWDVPKMYFGNQPRDGGHFVISLDEREEILAAHDARRQTSRREMRMSRLMISKTSRWKPLSGWNVQRYKRNSREIGRTGKRF